MKQIEVAAAIIQKDHQILATQRGYGKFQGLWEFPGGKIEPGETKEEALLREIKEELDMQITIDQLFHTLEYDYPDFHLTLHCFLCSLFTEHFTLTEHLDALWLDKTELDTLDWLPANTPVIERLKSNKYP